MDLSNLDSHLKLIEKLGFITNCPPDVNLQVYHDTLREYCRHLNEYAISLGLYSKPMYECVHYNEPSGDYIGIYKNMSPFKFNALNLINQYADNNAKLLGQTRNWP